jgi:hypothetical protein
MNEHKIDNENYLEPEQIMEERKLNLFLVITILTVWIISMFILFNQNY